MSDTRLQEPRDAEAYIAPVPRVTIQAFCERQDTASAIAAAASDRRMLKAHVKLHMGGAPAAVEAFRDAPTPNVIVLEANGSRETLIQHLDELAEFCDAGTKVVVIGTHNDILLYRELISRGVSDYVVAPVTPMMFVQSVSSLYNDRSGKSLGRVIAVTGVKGGVGASTITHNLSFLVARNFDTPTVLVDLDMAYGTAALNFNQDPTNSVADAVSASGLDAALVDRLLARCTDRLSLLAAPATLDRVYDPSEETFDGLIDILRVSTPMIFLDMPTSWTASSRRVLIAADGIVLVATPDLACLRNTKNMYDVLRAARPNDSAPRVILNMTACPSARRSAWLILRKQLKRNHCAPSPSIQKSSEQRPTTARCWPKFRTPGRSLICSWMSHVRSPAAPNPDQPRSFLFWLPSQPFFPARRLRETLT